jgi:hypothetical protein
VRWGVVLVLLDKWICLIQKVESITSKSADSFRSLKREGFTGLLGLGRAETCCRLLTLVALLVRHSGELLSETLNFNISRLFSSFSKGISVAREPK